MSTAFRDQPRGHVEIRRAAPGDLPSVAARLNATLAADEADDHQYQRGREEGITWARDYATAGELRGLVDRLRRGRYGDLDGAFGGDDPHWRGFLEGAEEVLDYSGAPADDAAAAEPAVDFGYERGHADGMTWAREYATAGELRDLVEHSEWHSSEDDGAHWKGFVDGAEEVFDQASPLLDAPIPHDYHYFVKWLLEVAP